MQDKPVALVTGANQGIGLQIAKDLVAHGFTVLVGSRNFERGEAAAKEVGPDAHALQLDVTDQASIATAAERVRNEFGRLDVLSKTRQSRTRTSCPASPSRSTQRAPARATCRSMKCARCGTPTCSASSPFTRRCCRCCERRRQPASSGVGSLTTNSDPAFPYRSIFGPVYPASKTALNALTVAMAIELEPEGIKVNAVSPGFTKTNLNGNAGTETVEEGAREAVRVALLGPEAPTGTFTRWENSTIPW